MIEFQSEKPITMAEAAGLLPRRRAGKKCSATTIYRWTTRGLHGVVLESVQIGATRCTSAPALNRFFASLTARNEVRKKPSNHTAPSLPSDVDAELDRLGV